jgi:hypothetical protein
MAIFTLWLRRTKFVSADLQLVRAMTWGSPTEGYQLTNSAAQVGEILRGRQADVIESAWVAYLRQLRRQPIQPPTKEG